MRAANALSPFLVLPAAGCEIPAAMLVCVHRDAATAVASRLDCS